MSIIRKLVYTRYLTLPKPITPYLHSNKLLKEYYTIEYVSGDKRIYDDYISLPKGAKKMLRDNYVGKTHTIIVWDELIRCIKADMIIY